MQKSILVALLISAPVALAQTALSPEKDDILAAQKIYSPYVERTVQDKNFAEGLYWVIPIFTRTTPKTPG